VREGGKERKRERYRKREWEREKKRLALAQSMLVPICTHTASSHCDDKVTSYASPTLGRESARGWEGEGAGEIEEEEIGEREGEACTGLVNVCTHTASSSSANASASR